MKWLRKNSLTILVACAFVFLYFFLRTFHLLHLPIFTDEAIYMRWAQIAHNDASWRFISLTDGKQPLFIWLTMPLFGIFPDPLFAGRMVSVFSGFFSLVGLFFVTRELFRSTKIGLLSVFVYIIFPFGLLYDRLALYDSLVAMFMIWSMYFTVLLARHRRLDVALILGMIIGAGLLTKSSVSFALILLPFSLLLYQFTKKIVTMKLFQYIGLCLVTVIMAQGITFILRLSPFYYIIGQKNLTFVYSFSEWIHSPFAFVGGNVNGMNIWLMQYMTIPFLLLVVASFWISNKYLREKLFLLMWFVVPYVALAFFGKVIYPRYLLFMTMPLLILGAFALYEFMFLFKKKWWKWVVVSAFLLPFLFTDFFILTNLSKAPIATGDKDQLVNGWAAGKGVRETVTFIQNEAKDKNIFVGTQGTFGLMPYALEMYLSKNPHITIKSYWPIDAEMPEALSRAAKVMPTYVVFYQPCPSCQGVGLAPASWNLTKVMQFEKGKGNFYTLYKVN